MDALLILTEAMSLEDALLIAAQPLVGSTIKLGRTEYRVVNSGWLGVDLLGKRGGTSTLVRNQKNPAMWSRVTLTVGQRSEWYRWNADGTFTPAS